MTRKLIFKIILSLGFLVALLLHMDIEALKEASHLIKASAWGYALIFIMAQLLLLSLRWMYLINVGRYRVNYSESVEITLASLVANLIFVTTISGIVVRVAMALQYGASLFKVIFATALDRLMTLAALLLLTAIFLPSFGTYVDFHLQKNIAMLIGALMLVIFVFTPLLTLRIIQKLPNFSLSKGNFRSGLRYLKLLLNNNLLLGKILSVSLIAQLCFFFAVYHISISAGVSLSFLQIMVVLPAIAIISSLPFSFGGWGIREGAFVYGLGLLNIPMEIAFSISIQIGLISLIATMVAGIPTLITSDSPFKKEQKIAVENKNYRK